MNCAHDHGKVPLTSRKHICHVVESHETRRETLSVWTELRVSCESTVSEEVNSRHWRRKAMRASGTLRAKFEVPVC